MPNSAYWVAFKSGKGSSDLAPVIVLNAYTDEEDGDARHQVQHDVIWFSNSRLFDFHGITVDDPGIRAVLDNDLASEDCFVLCHNWCDTITPGEIAGAVNCVFGDGSVTPNRDIRVVGVATVARGLVVGYDSGVQQWHDVLTRLPADVTARLSPASSLPYYTAFDGGTSQITLPRSEFELSVKSESSKLHSGCQPGLLLAVEYTAVDGGMAFAWLPNTNTWRSELDGEPTLSAFHVHTPNSLAASNLWLAEQLGRNYWDRDIIIGDTALIPSLKPIHGGIRVRDVQRCVYALDHQYLTFLTCLPSPDVFSMAILEDEDGVLHRQRLPPLQTLIDASQRLLLLSNNFTPAARATLQREMEYACLGKSKGLRYLTFTYSCPVEHFLALPVASSGMQWTGDDRLTLKSGSDFSASELALNAVSLCWDMDGERAGKRGKALANFAKVYSRAQDDQRPKPKPTYISYCLETARLTVGVAVAQLNSAFTHIPESAQLPLPPELSPGDSRKRKWSPSLQTWVDRSLPDTARSVVMAVYRHLPWPCGGASTLDPPAVSCTTVCFCVCRHTA